MQMQCFHWTSIIGCPLSTLHQSLVGQKFVFRVVYFQMLKSAIHIFSLIENFPKQWSVMHCISMLWFLFVILGRQSIWLQEAYVSVHEFKRTLLWGQTADRSNNMSTVPSRGQGTERRPQQTMYKSGELTLVSPSACPASDRGRGRHGVQDQEWQPHAHEAD